MLTKAKEDSSIMVPVVAVEEIPVVMAEEEGADVRPLTTTTPVNQYELISGLWVRFSEDADILLGDDGCVSIRAKAASLGDSLWNAQGVSLQAKLIGHEIHDLVLSIEQLALDPLVTRDQVVEFLNSFGLPQEKEGSRASTTVGEPMAKEQWEQFLHNVRNDARQTSNASFVSSVDFKIPRAQVRSTRCQLFSHTLEFPDCQGSDQATVRTLLEYYTRSVLNKMDLLSGEKADMSWAAVASDVASVQASIVGATIGSVFLGPAGFVAGSYLGNQLIRRSGTTTAGAVAGAALFGPVGLVAGAVAGSGGQQKVRTRPNPRNNTLIQESGQAARRSVVEATADHMHANRYDYAGSTGVLAGAVVGLAVAGPIGLVAGSIAGSLSSRKLVEQTTTPTKSNHYRADENNGKAAAAAAKPPGYRFGDFTRGIVARGKQSRAADANDGYRFGDFARGLINP